MKEDLSIFSVFIISVGCACILTAIFGARILDYFSYYGLQVVGSFFFVLNEVFLNDDDGFWKFFVLTLSGALLASSVYRFIWGLSVVF